MNRTDKSAIGNFDELVRVYSRSSDDFFFIQIGANDGRNGDPLYVLVTEFGWRGILVEPQKWVYENLLIPNYANHKDLVFENVAIDGTDGQRELFMLSFSRKRWATGLASFKRTHLEDHIDAGYVDRMIGTERNLLPSDREDFIYSELVPTMTFDTLLDKHDVMHLDLLQIDTEGHDYQLLQLFDFDRIRPEIVQFEHHVMTDAQRTHCRKLLDHYNYTTFLEHINMVGVQRDVVNRLNLRLDVVGLQ